MQRSFPSFVPFVLFGGLVLVLVSSSAASAAGWRGSSC